ncbi:hypothetical protein D7J10_22795 [Salmonella enterica]|nr:hypothetical protein [Salmonella enterica]EDQ2076313.1 hypothetical protein [Salmonella enterica]EGF1012360.1 hypothetical protein [Salmonella enterica]EJG9144829.1 hypothetical protein [Salmonella enterica]ELX2371127.1 hypothetical protein [Salmonella enterica]
MKKTAIAAALLCLFASNIASAGEKVDANDPCTVFLCMAGKVRGETPSECSGPNKTFFKIVKKKKGSIKWSKTFDARKDFLNQCSSADPAAISKIMSKFGKVKG